MVRGFVQHLAVRVRELEPVTRSARQRCPAKRLRRLEEPRGGRRVEADVGFGGHAAHRDARLRDAPGAQPQVAERRVRGFAHAKVAGSDDLHPAGGPAERTRPDELVLPAVLGMNDDYARGCPERDLCAGWKSREDGHALAGVHRFTLHVDDEAGRVGRPRRSGANEDERCEQPAEDRA